jgi:hypothetical protein
LTAWAEARFMASESARLRPDSAIIVIAELFDCDRAACRSQSPF